MTANRLTDFLSEGDYNHMPHPVDVAVGNRVRELRTRAGMSQTDLGVKLGVSFQQVQKYEKGVNRMGASRLIQICDALEVPITELFDGISSVSEARDRDLVDPETMRIARDIQQVDDDRMKGAIRQLIRAMGKDEVY